MSWRQKSFDVLPALTVRRQALRQCLRTVTVAWMFGIVWMACAQGSQMTVFGRMLGFTEWDFGILTAIPFAATFFQLVAAVTIERTGLRKYQFIYFATTHRLLWIVMAGIGVFASANSRGTAIVFLVVFGASSALAHLSSPPWQTWMGDLIPRRIRGRYFANRAIWTIPIQVSVALGTGLLLDYATQPPPAAVTRPADAVATTTAAFAPETTAASPDVAQSLGVRPAAGPAPPSRPAPGPTTRPAESDAGLRQAAPAAGSVDHGAAQVKPTRQSQPYLLWAVAGLFAIGGVFGAIDILLFLSVREIVSPPLVGEHDRLRPLDRVVLTLQDSVKAVAEAFNDRVFRHYVMYGACMTFGMAVCNQFLWLNALENVHYSKLGANLAFLVFSQLSSFNVIRLWGKAIDRWGRRPILMLCTLGVVFGPAGWFLIPPGNMPLAYALGIGTSMISGAMWSGLNLAQTNIIIGFTESSGRSKFIAAAAVVTSLGGFLGGLTGGALADAFKFMQQTPLHVGPFLWNNYHVTFLASSLMRAIAVLWLIGMPEPGAKPFRLVVRNIWTNVFNNVTAISTWPIRAFRTREPDDDQP